MQCSEIVVELRLTKELTYHPTHPKTETIANILGECARDFTFYIFTNNLMKN
jgi:hypothetical protein